MNKIDEFKAFVKTKPSLISFVRNGDMTWQKFYEVWDLYGPTHSEWDKYTNVVEKSIAKTESFGLGEIFGMIKKIDMEGVRKNIGGIQKAIGLIQDMTNKGDSSTSVADVKAPYTPRPVYRRFED